MPATRNKGKAKPAAAKRKDAREALRDRLVERLSGNDKYCFALALDEALLAWWNTRTKAAERVAARRIADLLAGSEGQ